MHNKHGLDWARTIHSSPGWMCQGCQHESGGFDTQEQLLEHVRKAHPEEEPTTNPHQRSRARENAVCALCGTITSSMSAHIADHLVIIALWSIRWWDDDSGVPDASARSVSAHSKRASELNSECVMSEMGGDQVEVPDCSTSDTSNHSDTPDNTVAIEEPAPVTSHPLVEASSDGANNPERLRGAIYDHVSEPLRTLHIAQWKDPATDEVQPALAVTPSQTPAPFPASNLSSAAIQRDPVAVILPGSTVSRFVAISKVSRLCLISKNDSSTLGTSSATWFNQMEKLSSILQGRKAEKDSDSRPAKIAILDTGVEKGYARVIKQYRDFTRSYDTNETCQDNTGQGAIAVRLVLEICYSAEIYVGRVFESSEANDNTVGVSLMSQVTTLSVLL